MSDIRVLTRKGVGGAFDDASRSLSFRPLAANPGEPFLQGDYATVVGIAAEDPCWWTDIAAIRGA